MIRVTVQLTPTAVDILDLHVEESGKSRAEIIESLLLTTHPVRLINNPDLFDHESEQEHA